MAGKAEMFMALISTKLTQYARHPFYDHRDNGAPDIHANNNNNAEVDFDDTLPKPLATRNHSSDRFYSLEKCRGGNNDDDDTPEKKRGIGGAVPEMENRKESVGESWPCAKNG